MDVTLEKRKGYLLLTFNTGGKYNVFTTRFMIEMIDSLSEIEKIRDPHYLVIRGENGNFGAGADVKELLKANGDKEYARVYFGHMKDLFVKMLSLNKVTIGLVEGVAYGASMELLLALDLVIGKKGTRFAAPGGRLGVFPPVLVSIGPYLLGHRASRKLAMLGEELDTQGAINVGLIDYEVEDMDKGLMEVLNRLKAMSPSALVRMRKLILLSLIPHLEKAFDELATQVTSDEAKEGISSFFSKTTPSWSSVGFS
ncbi:3-hydroxypropionyl-coenzyme A dehydratase [Metallosphaera sp. J1]|uniref:enoyl-CoA hydratase/isomerase family protein n=1 Tax=Metallosphaera javensis (ex Hofmann et al. 2022) TaxID=99938 RepID=UPI001EE14A1A|nr:enoyl-CoA hydratase/isomerase family protein [Metallosphaera javensis (ex Hofmann et al. 2022)]MCG3108328.1 3-hydroxypropionyl-coenzyme A dehydratase [Metallosphaera javensis (ex Hofmann et al. 2022)]